jgi:hypothetical protein
MQPLVIKVEDTDTGDTWVYVREESPVLLGRGAGATLPIGRPFVSAAHGTFTYDDARACWTYADLDSASGTRLGDRRLAAEEVVALPPASVLHVGTLAFTVLAEPPSERAASDDASPFAVGAPALQTATARLPVLVEPAPEAPSPLAGGTLMLPEGLSEEAPRPPQRQTPPDGAPPRRPAHGRAVRIVAVAIGATLVSGLATWLVVRPAGRRPLPDVAREVEPEPPAPPARRMVVQPEAPPPRDEPPAQAPSPPRPKRRNPAPPAEPVRRGANGAFVLE